MTPDPTHLTVDTVRRGADTVLVVSGEIDLATADGFLAAVAEQLARGPVVIDLAGLRFMDSSGVLALDKILRQADRDGRQLTFLAEFRDPVRAVLEMTGLFDALPIHTDPERSGR